MGEAPPPGPFTIGETETMRELAQDHPTVFTFTRYNAFSSNLDPHGHVAMQILRYRIEKMRRAARRLEEQFARAAAPVGYPEGDDAHA